LKQAQKKLRRLERQKSRRKNGGKNRKKTVTKLAKQHARIATIRQDATHKLTSYLCKNHALVAIEDLNTAGMLKNHCLAGAVSDSNFGEIKRQLLYKRKREGIFLVIIDRFHPSSKKCSCCSWINEELTLTDRVFVCLDCGYIAERDEINS
jgi:putative transposase